MERSSFFNSVGGDRKYKAADWAAYFGSFIGNGVFPQPSDGLQVVAGDGMQVIVKAGKAWINGYFYWNDSDLIIELPTAEGALNRYERIIARWHQSNRNIRAVNNSSTPSASPVPPALQRNADAYELCLADVYVGKGVTQIVQANITDRRFDTNLCGIVTGTVEEIDPSVITAQFDNFFELYRNLIAERYATYNARISGLEADAQADYEAFLAGLRDDEAAFWAEVEAWFNSVKGILSGDIATSLALAVDDLQRRVAELEAKIEQVDVYTVPAWLGNCYLGSTYLSTVA